MASVTVPDLPVLRHELLALLACPEDHGVLVGWDGAAPDATLVCAVCGQTFPVTDGLPRLLPDGLREGAEESPPAPNSGSARLQEGEWLADLSDPPRIGGGGGHSSADDEKKREIAARDEQAADYDRMLGLRLFSIPEIPLTLRYLALEPGHLLLEGGCGTGRMTPAFAARTRGVVCVDFSAESLRAARAKLPPELAARVLFIQADLSRLPLRDGVFDRVGSFQVLEHLPTHDTRARAVAEMARVLKGRREGGRFAFSAYRWGPPVSWLAAKQGHHEGGIPFFRATWPEMGDLLRPYFAVKQHTGALLYHFLVWGRKHL